MAVKRSRQKDPRHLRIYEYAHEDIEKLKKDFDVTGDGYSEEQVKRSREIYGANVLTGKREDTVGRRVLRAIVNPYMIIFLVIAIVSLVTDFALDRDRSTAGVTAAILLIMMAIGIAVRLVQELRGRDISRDLAEMVTPDVCVRRDGEWKEIDSGEVVVGDTVRMNAGDRVPADIRVIKASDFFLSQVALTSESEVSKKRASTIAGDDILYSDYENMVYMESTVVGGDGEGIVLAVGDDTLYGGMRPEKKKARGSYTKGANSIARVLLRFMTVLVVAVFLVYFFLQDDWVVSILFALAAAACLTPELFPMVVSACLARGAFLMRKKQTVVKDVDSMELLGGMDVLCVGNGALADNRLSLKRHTDISGQQSQKTLDFGYLNGAFHTGVENPVDSALDECAEEKRAGERLKKLLSSHKKIDELPFDYDRRFSDILVEGRDGRFLIAKGDVDAVCARCDKVEINGSVKRISETILSDAHAVADEMIGDGSNVVAVAYKRTDIDAILESDEKGLVLLGFLAFLDAPKKSAKKAMERLKSLGVGAKLLTGDKKRAVLSVCERIGIDSENIVTGEELFSMTPEKMGEAAESASVICSLSPRQKASAVQILKMNGHTVGFLGDAMNDLASVERADVGICVDNAADSVKDLSDVVLLENDLDVLGDGIVEGRKAFVNTQKYIKITAAVNFGNIMAAILAGIFLDFQPMTYVQLLYLDLVFDLVCLAIPWDNVDEQLYLKPVAWPVKRLSVFMFCFGPLCMLFSVGTFLLLNFVVCPYFCSFADLDVTREAVFQTGWFLETLWTQILAIFIFRTEKTRPHQSRPSVALAVAALAFLVLFTGLIYTPLGDMMGFIHIGISYYAFLVMIVVLYYFAFTGVKYLYTKRFKELL